MKIVTGHTGSPHITANDDQAKNQAIVGVGHYILNVGNLFAAELVDATTVSISDGEGMMQGVHFRTEPGTVDTISLTSGATGVNRIDLICARYTKDSATGIENVAWHVIEGTPAANPTRPATSFGYILEGATEVDFVLYEVRFTGLTPALTKVAKVRSLREKLLWENTSPRTGVSTLTVSLDLTDYDYVDVVYTSTVGVYEGGVQAGVVARHAKGSITQATQTATGTAFNVISRLVSVSASGVTFEAGKGLRYYNGEIILNTAATDYLVPYEIYGGIW